MTSSINLYKQICNKINELSDFAIGDVVVENADSNYKNQRYYKITKVDDDDLVYGRSILSTGKLSPRERIISDINFGKFTIDSRYADSKILGVEYSVEGSIKNINNENKRRHNLNKKDQMGFNDTPEDQQRFEDLVSGLRPGSNIWITQKSNFKETKMYSINDILVVDLINNIVPPKCSIKKDNNWGNPYIQLITPYGTCNISDMTSSKFSVLVLEDLQRKRIDVYDFNSYQIRYCYISITKPMEYLSYAAKKE